MIVGFGISNQVTFETVCDYVNGAIIGSAFINFLEEKGTGQIQEFVHGIIGA